MNYSPCLALLFLGAMTACAGSELKVIGAAWAETPPVIDGRLDEAGWKAAEVRTDITSIGDDLPLKRPTAMRMLYDENHLYLGLEFFWDDIGILKNGIAKIKEKHPNIQENVICPWQDITYPDLSVEVYIDRGATGVIYYHVLFNPAGQITGNLRMNFENFNLKPFVKSTVQEDKWVAELVLPFEGLRVGDEFGFNLCRNDETNYGIWTQVGGAYHNPRRFGRLVLGDYPSWWQAVIGKDVNLVRTLAADQDLAAYKKADPFLAPLMTLLELQIRDTATLAEVNPPVNRANFEILYTRYAEVRALSERLGKQYDTLRLMKKIR